MATVKQSFSPTASIPAASNGAPLVINAGTNFPVPAIRFDPNTAWTCYLFFRALSYGSGNISVKVLWYADTATSGDVIYGAALAAITPDSDTQDVETKAFATANTVTDTHLGTTGQRLHQCVITVTNLDSVAADDHCALKLYRDAAAGGDTMTGDALVVGIEVSYSDT